MPENDIKDVSKIFNNFDAASALKIKETGNLKSTPAPRQIKSDSSRYDEGFLISKGDPYADLKEKRAQNQPSLVKLGSGLANAAINVPLDIVKDASYLLDFENYMDFTKSSEEGFGNWLQQAIQSIEDKLELPVYRTKASEGFAPWSSGWWGENFPSILTTVSMAIPAQMAIKGISTAGKLIGGAKLISAIEKTSGAFGLSNTFKGVGAAVISRQMESLMEGTQTYEATYNKLKQEHPELSEQEIKRIAGEAAAKNYKLNWNAIIQDIPQYMILHKSFKEVSSAFSLKGLKEAAKIGFTEGGEEAYQFITDKESMRSALINNKLLPSDNSDIKDRLFDYAQDGDFWTSAFLGAIGGAGFGLYGVHNDKIQQQKYNSLLEMHKGIIKGDPETFNRGTHNELNTHITVLAASDKLEPFKQGLENIINNPERIKDHERPEIINRVKEAIEQVEYAQKIHKDIMNDQTLSDELKMLSFQSKLQQKAAENRLSSINNKIIPLQSKDILILNTTPDILEYKENKLILEGIKDFSIFEEQAKELEEIINTSIPEILKNHPEFKNKEELDTHITSSYDNELVKLYTNRMYETNLLNGTKDVNNKIKNEEERKKFDAEIAKRKKAEEEAKKKAEQEKKEQEEKEKLAEEQRKKDEEYKASQTGFTHKGIADKIIKGDKLSNEEEQFRRNNSEAIKDILKQHASSQSTESTDIEAKDAELAALKNKEIETSSIDTNPKPPEDVIEETTNEDIGGGDTVSNDTQYYLPDGSRTPDTIYKTLNSRDDGHSTLWNHFYRYAENMEINNHKFMVVTKTTHPSTENKKGLFEQIEDLRPEEAAWRAKNPNYDKGIYLILVDADYNIVMHEGMPIVTLLESEARIGKGIDVGRGLPEEEAQQAINDAKAGINKLRKDILALGKGEKRYLPIIDKSRGIPKEEGHSAFEDNLTSNNVIGRLFKENTSYNSIELYLPTLVNVWRKSPVRLGSLYTVMDNNRVVELLPRLITNEEIELIVKLIEARLKNKDNSLDEEIKKIISFHKHVHENYRIYINRDDRLVFGKYEIEASEFDSIKDELIAFLKNKRVNANSKLLGQTTIQKPSLTKDGEIINYKEYLLGGENPMFGTNLKPEKDENNKTIKRFLNTYFIYEPKLKINTEAIKDKEHADSIMQNNEAPVTDNQEQKITDSNKKSRPKNRNTPPPQNRLASVSKDSTPISQKEINWFKKSFPNIPIEPVIGLIEDKALGQFLSFGKVLLSDKATKGTLYHEAFHVVTQLYLTKGELNKLYTEADNIFSGKSRIELEEILAEDFIDYKETGKILNQPVRNNIFRKLLNFIKDLLGLSATNIADIYRRLDKGYYTNKRIVGVREFSKLNRDEKERKIINEKGTIFVNDVLNHIDNSFFGYLLAETDATPLSIIGNQNDIIEWIYLDFKEDIEKPEYAKYKKDYEYIISDENFPVFIKMWKKRLAIQSIELKADKDIEESDETFISKDEEQIVQTGIEKFFQDGNLTSTLENISSPTRLVIRTLTKVGRDRKPVYNSIGRVTTVDFMPTYTYLLNNINGTGSSYEDLYNRIKELADAKPEFNELLERIGIPSGDLDSEHTDFQTAFLQDFNKIKSESVITIFNKDGNIRTVDSTRLSNVEKIKTEWKANLAAVSNIDKDGKLTFDQSKISESDNALQFLHKLGIKFDKNTLDVINNRKYDDSKLQEAVAAIKKFIEYHKGDVTYLYEKNKMATSAEDAVNVQGRLNYLLDLEAKYTSKVNELSYISAAGKTEYSVGENNALSITINLINNAKNKAELFAKAPHLNTISTKNSVWLDELFDENGIKRPGTKIILSTHNGVTTDREEDKEVTKHATRKGTKGDLYAQQIASVIQGKSSWIVSSDKSTEYILYLENYNGNKELPIDIDMFKKDFNNHKLKQIFRGYFRNEVEKIALFTLDGLGENFDIYQKNGNEFTIFQDILISKESLHIKNSLKEKLNTFKPTPEEKKQGKKNVPYSEAKKQIDEWIEENLENVDQQVLDFFNTYFNEFINKITIEDITKDKGISKELLLTKNEDGSARTFEQIIRTVLVTDMINSIEQTKLFLGDLNFYKDPYKRSSMFAGTKLIPRIDDYMDKHLNKLYKRKDGKVADGMENIFVFESLELAKTELQDWIKAFRDINVTEEEAYSILGYQWNEKKKRWDGKTAYGKHDEADAMGYCTLDFYREFFKRLSSTGAAWTNAHEEAYQVMQEQEFDEKGNLVKGRLLNKKELALFTTLKTQYAGPTYHPSIKELYVPIGLKFTVMPLLPQIVAGRNLSKRLKTMIDNQVGISVFKSGTKFGALLAKENTPNLFYTQGTHGDITEEGLQKQGIYYRYLGLQVKPSEPHNTATFSTQFRKTCWIGAFENGKPNKNFPEAESLLNKFNSLIAQRTEESKELLLKELGFNKDNYTMENVSTLVDMLVKAAEARTLTDNIIDSFAIEEAIVEGKKILSLKYKIDASINKQKVDSMLTALVNSRIITHKFNGDAYVLAPVTGFEPIGKREIGTNTALRGYTKKENGETIPAEVIIPMTKAYYSLMKKHGGTLDSLNKAIKEGKVDPRSLELVACRIPGQGLNSNEYLIIKEFLPENSSTTMIVHPDIVGKAGSDFDNDKLYTYRANIDKFGEYIEKDIDNQIADVIKKVLRHPSNFTALITPNSTNIITPVVDQIKYIKYVNDKIKRKATPLSFEKYTEELTNNKGKIQYTDSIKLHKKVEARYKLWMAKDLVGPAAIINSFGPLAQMANLSINNSYTDYKGEVQKVYINFEHNTNEDGTINLAAAYDKLNINLISELRNQQLNIKVDAAKEEIPMVNHLNMNMETSVVYDYLLQTGVNFETLAYFFTQPIITKYLELSAINNNIASKAIKVNKPFGVGNEMLEDLESKVYKIFNLEPNSVVAKGLKGVKRKEAIKNNTDLFFSKLAEKRTLQLNKEQLKEALYEENQEKDNTEFLLLQYQVLYDYLQYKKQASIFSDYVRIYNFDSNGINKNLDAAHLKVRDTIKTINTRFMNNIDRIADTFIGSFDQNNFAIAAFSPLYYSYTQQITNKILEITNKIEEDNKSKLSQEDRIKLITTVRNDFINFITQNYAPAFKGKVQERINTLFTNVIENNENKKTSIANRLLSIKNSNDPKDSKIKELQVIKELFPLINVARPNWDNIRLFTKKLDTFVSNQLTESFRKLRLEDPILYQDIIELGILQSGLNNSPITYLGIIPFEDYNSQVKEAFEEFNKKPKLSKQIDLIKFQAMFIREKSNRLSMYGKNYDASKIEERPEQAATEIAEENSISLLTEFDKLPFKSETPTMTYAGIGSRETPQGVPAKEGVQELFESNPELANTVYEALGFNNYNVELKPYATDVWGKVPQQRGDNSFVAKEQYSIKLGEDKGIDVRLTIYFDDNNKTAFVSNIENFENDRTHPLKKGLGLKGFLKANQLIINRGYTPVVDNLVSGYGYDMLSKLEKSGYLTKVLDKRVVNSQYDSVKYERSPFIFTNKIYEPELTPQQKQQAQQLYSQYLDTIFPDSKVKDIVYHGSGVNIITKEGWKTGKETGTGHRGVLGHYFTKYLLDAKIYAQRAGSPKGTPEFLLQQGFIVPVIINSKIKTTETEVYDRFAEIRRWDENYAGFDTVTYGQGLDENKEVVVKSKEQIHILGSKQDIKGFKEFVQGKQFQKLTTEEIAKEQNNSLFGLNTQNQEQLEFHINTLNVVSKFLENVGIKQRLIPEFLSQDGSVVEGAIAAANFIEGTVDIIDDLNKGRTEAWNKLPEEAAHFWYRLLNENQPLKKLLWEAHQTEQKAIKLKNSQYGNTYEEFDTLKEEAIGQLIAEAIKRIETKNAAPEDYSFFKKFLEWINSIIDIFKTTNQDPFEVAAMKILSSDMSDLMTWEEYRKLNNIVNFADVVTEQSAAPIDYTLIEDLGSRTFISYINGTKDYFWLPALGNEATVQSPYFKTKEEVDNWVTANIPQLTLRQKEKLQEVRDNQIFFDRLLNKTFRKKSKFLPKTLRKYFDIIDAQNLNQLREWNISQELQQITKKLSDFEKKQIIETNGYTNIAPTLKVLPDLLQKYKKNPIVLSEPVKIDGAKKQELSILNGIREMIKLENPNLKSITAEEFVNEAHNWLQTNYLLGFANEKSYLSYRTDQTFSYLSDRQSNEDVDITNMTEEELRRLSLEERQRIANIIGLTKQNPDVYHNKVSLRFNDSYHTDYGQDANHFAKRPSAWGNLTYFYTGKNKWKDAVLLHEIQNDNIEALREFKAEKVDLETSLGRYLQQLNTDLLDNITQIESGGKKIIRNDIWSTNPPKQHLQLNYQLEQLKNLPLEQGLSQLKQNLNEQIELYKSDSSKNPEKAQEAVEKAYSQRRIFQNFQKKGGIKSLLTKQELEDLKNILHQLNTEEIETYTWSDDDNGYFQDLSVRGLKQKKQDFKVKTIELQARIARELQKMYGDDTPLINLFAPAKARTKNQIRQGVQRSQELNENVNWLLAYSEKKISNELSKTIEESKRNYIQARNATVANNFNVQLSKITLEQWANLVENYTYNQDLLNRLIDEQAQKDINSSELQKQSKAKSIISYLGDDPSVKLGKGKYGFMWDTANTEKGIVAVWDAYKNANTSEDSYIDNWSVDEFLKYVKEVAPEYLSLDTKSIDKEKQQTKFETLKQKALDKKAELEKNYGKIEEEVKQTLEVEMNYFTPLVHHLIQKHINQYGKDFPMYFSGYQITKLTQGNDRTAMIYAGKDEINIVDKKFEINGKKYSKTAENTIFIDGKLYKVGGHTKTSQEDYNKAKQEYEKAYQQATERRAKEIKFEAAKQIGFLSNEHNGTNLSDLTDKELDEGIKELNQYKKQSKQNMDRVINTIMNISNNKPIETGAIYNAMSQISGIKLIWQDKIDGLKGNTGGYLVDLTNYNYNAPILYGLNTSKVVPINPNMVDNSEIQYSKKQGYNPKTITDEYGNTWNEIEIKPEHTESILFNKSTGFLQDVNLKENFFEDSNVQKTVTILEKIAASKHPLSALAAKLIPYAKLVNIDVFLMEGKGFHEEKFSAVYSPRNSEDDNTATIKIARYGNFKGGDATATLIHEVIHSITYHILKENTEANRVFRQLYEYAKSVMPESYSLSNIDEFMTGIFTNSKFINQLINTPSLKGVQKFENLFKEIFDFILKLFGINKGETLYEQAFAVATNIIEDFKKTPIYHTTETADILGLGAESFEEPKPDYLEVQNSNLETLKEGKKTISIRTTLHEYKIGEVMRIIVDKKDTGIKVRIKDIVIIPDFTELTKEEQDRIARSAGDYKDLDDYMHRNPYLDEESERKMKYDTLDSFIKGYAAGQIITYEKIDDTKEDIKLKELYTKQLASLKSRRKEYAGENDNTERNKIQLRINAISASIAKLEFEMSYANILSVALRDLNEIKELIANPNNISVKDLQFIKNTLDRLVTLDQYIIKRNIDNSLLMKLQKINTEAIDLLETWKELTSKLIEEISTKEGTPTTLENLLKPVKDLSSSVIGKARTLGLNTTNIPILRLMDRLFESIKLKTIKDIHEFNVKYEEITSKLKKEDIEILTENGRLITKTKGEYFEKEKKMLQTTASKLEGNLTAKDKALVFKEIDQWYIAANDYTLTQEGIDLYESHLKALQEGFDREDDGTISIADEIYLQKWITKHSPYLGIKYANGEEQTRGNYKWYKYLSYSPKQHYINPKYEQIKDNPAYKFIVDTIETGLKKIPHRMIVDLNSFDKVLNSVIFDFVKEDSNIIKAAWSGIGDFWNATFKTAINQQDIEGYGGKYTDEEGRDKYKVKSKSLQEIQKEKKYKNPLELAKEFYKMAVAYEHKTEVEPVIWMLKDMLDEQEAVKVNKHGVPINQDGIIQTIKNGLENAKKMAKVNILAELYDKRRLDEEANPPTEKEKKEFNERIKKWEIEKDAAILEGREIPEKPVLYKTSGVKILDAIVDFTRANLLWFKPLSGANNLLIGLNSNFLHAARKKDFTDIECFKALKLLMNSMLNYYSVGQINNTTAKKIRNLSALMGIDTESFTEDQNEYTAKIAKYGLTLQSSGEYIIANHIMLSKMLHTKFKNLKGEDSNLWEAFDEDGVWKEAEYGKQEDVVNVREFQSRLKEVRQQTQGDYQSALAFKSTVDGRILMLFRTWLPRMVNNRFGEQVGEEFKGRYITYKDVFNAYTEHEGFWKGAAKFAGRQFLGVLTKIANIPGLSQLGMKSLSELCNKEYEEELKKMGLTELDIENMRVNVRELQYIVYISIIVLLLKAMGGNDKPDKDTTFLINLGTRIYQDLTFFYSFNSATAITKDPIPIYKTIQDSYDLINKTMNLIQDPQSDIYERGRHKGESKAKVALYKLIPGISAYESTMNTMEQVFNNNKKYTK